MTAIAMRHQPGTRGKDVANSIFDHDLVRNTARPAPQVYAGIVAGAVESPAVREAEASDGALDDRRTEARIAAVLSDVDAIKTRARTVYVSVSDGVVTLYGAVRDSGAVRDIKEAVRTSAGIDAVQNNIHTIGARVSD
jgi:osmotically-inducible protein OsmY